MESGLCAKLVFFAVRAKGVGAVICESLLRIGFPRAFFLHIGVRKAASFQKNTLTLQKLRYVQKVLQSNFQPNKKTF